MTDFNDSIERLAELEGKAAKAAHDIWAHWMKYMFTQGKYQQSNFVISFENVARWQRQMMTEFKDLLPQEQKSDFEIADHFIAPLFREMAQALSEAQAENVGLKGRFLDHAETDSYLRMVKYAAHVKDLYRWEKEQKEAMQTERDALQARVDGALMPLKSVAGVARHWAKYSGSADKSDLGCVVVKAIEILTGEGE